MTCPKDADTDYIKKEFCLVETEAIFGTLKCTRDKGHKGKHHAHGPRGICYNVWK